MHFPPLRDATDASSRQTGSKLACWPSALPRLVFQAACAPAKLRAADSSPLAFSCSLISPGQLRRWACQTWHAWQPSSSLGSQGRSQSVHSRLRPPRQTGCGAWRSPCLSCAQRCLLWKVCPAGREAQSESMSKEPATAAGQVRRHSSQAFATGQLAVFPRLTGCGAGRALCAALPALEGACSFLLLRLACPSLSTIYAYVRLQPPRQMRCRALRLPCHGYEQRCQPRLTRLLVSTAVQRCQQQLAAVTACSPELNACQFRLDSQLQRSITAACADQ